VGRAASAVIRVGAREHPCEIENTSPGGAGLRVNAGLLLPQQFDLVIASNVIPVLLMWRQADRLGVRFSPSWRGPPKLQRFLAGTGPRPD